MPGRHLYEHKLHAAVRTDSYVFSQLIPYIGNKRKLLGLIHDALGATGAGPGATFLDLFAGSGVVSRFAKTLGFRVIANDWEPYAHALNGCYVACNSAPPFRPLGGYLAALETLNNLPPRTDWVTEHLCPRDDAAYDTAVDRMFYMRKNGRRLDACRHQIAVWREDGVIDASEEACLLAPLLYQACYVSNTSGVFKGFHNGWGGQTGTALYRIASDLRLRPAVFHDNGLTNEVLAADAAVVARQFAGGPVDVAYLDPPYNQHPYGSNYHVLNSLTLWDKPEVSRQISSGSKSAIRRDWRELRRSDYNHRGRAAAAYRDLVHTLNARFVLTSYSTDGTIPLEDLLEANVSRGQTRVFPRAYKRYRVSSQRFSEKPLNVEFVVVLDTARRADAGVDELTAKVKQAEESALQAHPETAGQLAAQPRPEGLG